MGCDIHLIVERKAGRLWQRVMEVPLAAQSPWHRERMADARDTEEERARFARWALRDWYDDRNYNVFSMLAGVRNYYGEPIVPVAEPRGLPTDISGFLDGGDTWYESRTEYDAHNALAGDDRWEDDRGFWLGDHSYSWLTVRELLDYPHWKSTRTDECLVPLDEFTRRMAENDTGQPRESCRGAWGPHTTTITEEEARTQLAGRGILTREMDRVYVQTTWQAPYSVVAGRFYSQVLPELAKLDPDPSNVRIVFGFDS